ncbi:DNA damage checkpoint protein Lcd1p [Monosporozyma unispora]|nr:lethal, checkpoint-defective, DNA damage sensitive protein [Kazachstania unispora]
MSNDDDLFSSDDDDLILELANKPLRFTQAPQKSNIPNLNNVSNTKAQVSTIEPIQGSQALLNKPVPDELQNKLNKAQGEASMLRDKIELLNKSRDKERAAQVEHENQIKNENIQELDKLKQIIQKLEDEKKFLVMESKTLKTTKKHADPHKATSSFIELNKTNDSTLSANSSTVVELKTVKSSPMLKKRKVSSDILPKPSIVQLNTNRIMSDETNQLFDKIMTQRLNQCDMTTLEILNTLKLGYIKVFDYKEFIIKEDHSIGESITTLLLNFKNSLSLDKFIDVILENIATLIKEISFHEKETNLAIPFLVAIMFQTITFRPSAVPYSALRDLFLFLCDLVKKNQHVLKKTLLESPLELHVEPQVFQYEMIDDMIICYSFDTLEMILRILQTHVNKDEYFEFLNINILQNIEHLYKLCFSISYKPILNVIFNMVEILNTVTNITMIMANNIPKDSENSVPPSKWWENCLPRLYTLLSKTIKNYDQGKESDLTTFTQRRCFNIAGLIRNIGTNSWSKFISQLIYRDKLQFLPRVICKDEILREDNTDPTLNKLDFNFEKWLINLKDDILITLENLLYIYHENDDTVANSDMLVNLTRLLAREQEEILEIYIGQDNPNIMLKVKLVEHIIKLIYQLMIHYGGYITDQHIKTVESELVTALWRVVVSQVDDHIRSRDDMKDHRHLIDKLNELTLRDDKSYYEDAFESLPEYIVDELLQDLEERSYKIMQIKYDKMYQEMAKTILESKLNGFITMDETDSLYVAMGM